MCCGKPGHLFESVINLKMAYTVLARKYRSQTFDDIIGQGPVSITLKNAIKTGRVAHAFLFSGTRGIGKTTMARVLAKALNCLSFNEPTTEPCCKCESCIAVNKGDDLDVIEIDGASNNGVDQVRQLRENAIYRPARSRFKIYIIDEVHMLSTGAFNALLKILEEPPSHVKFIFATTEPNKVIATIQSRCQRFDFKNISPKEIADHLKSILKQEKIKYDEDIILPLAKMANGSMRDGLSLLDRLISTGAEPLSAGLLEEFLGCANSDTIYQLIDKIGDSDSAATLEIIEDLTFTGLSEIQIVDSLIDSMRDLMVVKSAGDKTELLILNAQQRKQVSGLAEKFDIAGIIYSITTLEKLRWTIKNSDTPKTLLEASLLRLALNEHFLNVDTLLSQLQGKTTGSVKKKLVSLDHTPKASPEHNKPDSQETVHVPKLTDLSSVKNNWPDILNIIGKKLGKGTEALLNSATPTALEDNLLVLTMDRASKQMCESTGKKDAIQKLLRDCFGKAVNLKLEATDDEKQSTVDGQAESNSEKRNAMMKDPGVKTVLVGLGATITGIEEEQ